MLENKKINFQPLGNGRGELMCFSMQGAALPLAVVRFLADLCPGEFDVHRDGRVLSLRMHRGSLPWRGFQETLDTGCRILEARRGVSVELKVGDLQRMDIELDSPYGQAVWALAYLVRQGLQQQLGVSIRVSVAPSLQLALALTQASVQGHHEGIVYPRTSEEARELYRPIGLQALDLKPFQMIRLKSYGVQCIGDVQDYVSDKTLCVVAGSSQEGRRLKEKVWGYDFRSVR